MTNEKLQKANDLFSQIHDLKNQLDYADKIILFPGFQHPCDKSLKDWAVPLDKKVRTYLKTVLTQELNKVEKEFAKL